jgi:hypothetical protein
MGKDGITTYSRYQSNEMLFRLANESKGMEECGLTLHRALHDAKAERNWLTKLPQLALYVDSRLQCGVSLQKNFRCMRRNMRTEAISQAKL